MSEKGSNSHRARSSSGCSNSTTKTHETATTTKVTVYNTFYDARWEEKQCGTFANWLNNLFQPFGVPNETHGQRSEEWKAAATLFNSLEMKAARYSIESEVENGHLAMRSDQNVLADIRVHDRLLNLLLSYSERWLQLGLEMVLSFHCDQSQKVCVMDTCLECNAVLIFYKQH